MAVNSAVTREGRGVLPSHLGGGPMGLGEEYIFCCHPFTSEIIYIYRMLFR